MIKVRIWNNTSCIKCNNIYLEMLTIGAFIMCEDCWREEFKGIVELDTESSEYEIYRKWFSIYKNRYYK